MDVDDGLPHDRRGCETIVAVSLCMSFATVAVCLRLYARQFILRQLWVDDYLAIAGMIGMIVNGIVQCVQTGYGLGDHIWDLGDDERAMTFWKLFYTQTITYSTTLMFIKFSFFFQYYRLIQDVPHYRVFYITAMAVVSGWVIAQEFILIFTCTPIPKFWNSDLPGTCMDGNLIGWMNGVGNIVTDLIILVLPIPVVWRLNLKRGRRWAVLGIFALGFFTCVVSICRLVFFAKLSADFTYDLVDVAAWGEAEASSGLICSSLIAMGPLIRRFSHRFRSVDKASATPGYPFAGTGAFSRHTLDRDKSLLRANSSSKKQFDGSETELNRIDPDQQLSRKDEMHDDGSTKSSGLEQSTSSEYPGPMPDLRLGLKTGIQTIISSGDHDSIRSPLPTDTKGIVVRQVWSVRNKESTERSP
ncbi:hypothetical protein GGS23DRAFT_583685 [Durotheca rogersii]|uniref:uncharacterized protein n=1 Tax=Durotheca rogersii TaxID=419775 RepID=UPI00221EDA07|nr:uncharacterized protein GGS23DRAFT_583685 [Durotheca rogersii]KAI5859800.1 hypothetical protein GGS23DRAFT_583685 [Durotheca rogersii]